MDFTTISFIGTKSKIRFMHYHWDSSAEGKNRITNCKKNAIGGDLIAKILNLIAKILNCFHFFGTPPYV